jgi:predicted PurR-regulated permease PerM
MRSIYIVRYLQIIVLSGIILYFGKILFIPLFFGLLVAIILYPTCKALEKKRWPKSLAISVSLGIVTIFITAFLWLLTWQTQILNRELPGLINKFESSTHEFQHWLEANLNFDPTGEKTWLQNLITGENLFIIINGMANATLNMFFYMFIVPIFAAIFLFHRRHFVYFLEMISGKERKILLTKVLEKSIHTYFNFIKGMVLIYPIVGILNSIGLLALGIKHAVLFGMLTAIMTIIPYFGIIISALIPISVAWVTKDSIWYPIGVVAVFAFVQYLEANVIFPAIVGKQLDLSTWSVLIAALAGGILWGTPGMILFIPFVAILKIISDNIDVLKPLNILLSRTPDEKT